LNLYWSCNYKYAAPPGLLRDFTESDRGKFRFGYSGVTFIQLFTAQFLRLARRAVSF